VNKQREIESRRQRRRWRVRKKLPGDAVRPRLCIHRSNKHMSCQIIDDVTGRTVVAASTQDEQLRGQISKKGNKEAAVAVGKAIAQKALAAGVQQVRFDRGHYRYHGRIAALADAAREAGLSL
jgi:large subunit ribosomal protein L18